MKIFIGCASESTPTADRVAALVADCGHKPLPWYELTAFPAGRMTLSTLIDLAREVDAAILVFAGVDEVSSRGTRTSAPRDNVLLEFGLFAGVLGYERCIVCALGDPKIPEDLAGITYINLTNEYAAKVKLKAWITSIEAGPVHSDVIQIGHFKSSDHERFTERIQDRLAKAKNIVMMGSGVAILGRPGVVEDLMSRAASGNHSNVEIFLANPWSPGVEVRLIEEEQGSIRPPDGKRGLLARLDMLLACWQRFERPACVKISLCAHYPTFALLIIDDDYFIYPYSYRLLGNFSPAFAFSRKDAAHKDIIKFLDHHYQRIKADAIEAEKVLRSATLTRDELVAFAIFFVPRADSDLYKFGTSVVGYDVRTRSDVHSRWSGLAGKASDFGFHLTICDALYFYSDAEVRSAMAEVAYLAKEFGPFELRGLKVRHEYPGKNQVALAVVEASDDLLCLHYEFVQRIYRRAAASDYTLDNNLLTRHTASERLHTMTRYRAPHILNKFQPHFTLLSSCGLEGWKSCGNDLNESFSKVVSERMIKVDRLAIMSRSDNGRWFIKDEIGLS
jgi:hypothetical protein